MVRLMTYSFNSQIPDGGISSAKIADGAITEAKLDSGIDFGVSAGTKKEMTADETIAVCAPVRVSLGSTTHLNYLAEDNDQTGIFGESGSNEQYAVRLPLASASGVTSVTCELLKNGSPSDNVRVRIVNDNSTQPGSTTLGTSEVIAGSTITGTPAEYTFAFVTPVLLAAGTYWVILERTGSRDTSNYVYLRNNSNNSAPANTSAQKASGTWNVLSRYASFKIDFNDGTAGRVKLAKATDASSAKMLGFTTSALTSGVAGNVQNTGILGGFSGLTIGDTYYLKDDGSIGTTAGTVSKKVGRAVSATELSIDIEE